MMETESSQIRSRDQENEIGHDISNPSTTKQELGTEGQYGMGLLEGSNSEFEATVKAENCTESDDYPVENMVKTELVEFRNNPYISPHDMMIGVTLEKIPKTETKILDDEPTNDEEDCDEEGDDIYNDVDSNSDPERDPFADIDCDPCFTQKPPPQSEIPKASATQAESINAMTVVANASSSNPPSSSPKSFKNNRERKQLWNNLQCQLCHETQHSKSKLKSHLEICEASHKNRRRFCELCNILFSVSQSYRKHALRMHGIKSAKLCLNSFKCPFCSRSFRREESLIVHTASHPESSPANDGDLKPRPFKCQECPATFSNSSALSNHMKRKKNERQFKCSVPYCEKAYNMSSHLKDHLRSKHSEEKTFKCQAPNCGKSYKLNNQLYMHMFSHSEEVPFKCSHADCDRAFKSKGALAKHLQVHAGTRRYGHITERPFKCGQCSSAFCKKWQLTVHLKLVHPKDDEVFECPEPNCETTFKYKHNLKVHLAAFHTGRQLSFTCLEPNCSKSFKTEKSAQEHLRTHTRPHECTERGCSATFSRSNYLNFHIESNHKK